MSLATYDNRRSFGRSSNRLVLPYSASTPAAASTIAAVKKSKAPRRKGRKTPVDNRRKRRSVKKTNRATGKKVKKVTKRKAVKASRKSRKVRRK